MRSIAKYTEDYTHLERCTPSIPIPDEPGTPVSEIYKSLESPKSYYATVVDPLPPAALPPAQTARLPLSKSNNSFEAPLSSSPPRVRKASTQMYPAQPNGTADFHISGHEPRAWPGVVHHRERRRSMRASTSGSDGNAPDLSSSGHLEPALAKLAVKEESEISATEDSD